MIKDGVSRCVRIHPSICCCWYRGMSTADLSFFGRLHCIPLLLSVADQGRLPWRKLRRLSPLIAASMLAHLAGYQEAPANLQLPYDRLSYILPQRYFPSSCSDANSVLFSCKSVCSLLYLGSWVSRCKNQSGEINHHGVSARFHKCL